MATAKKSSKKTEEPKEEPKEQPKVDTAYEALAAVLSADFTEKGGDSTGVTLHIATPDEYINSEYPWLETSQNIPQLLKVLVRETVKGRMK